MSALQTELLGTSLFNKSDEASGDFPEYDVTSGRASTKEEQHIAELAHEFREEVKSSMFYLHLPPPPRDVERYSDRYFKSQGSGYVQHPLKGLRTNVDLFPEELHTVILKKRVKRTRAQVDGGDDILEALKKTKDDDDDDAEDGDKDKEKKDGESDDDGIDGEIEEEEEEENDYMDSYFDNGEEDDMGDADDDDGGGAYY
ncbi:hypothetical protein IW140_000672 [Coemansia sp. RSA 1813]|nr:hypothetical protein EV178_000823 [Coemansia sp. RSA 1646]KAJ1773851.1 hypothetical protein LPJ74_000395 [Coemansia sp. RSA 1843]KAJ2092443.1 hypothetical protein IW138_001205 [Coemansia sp. RSA 986]KAJ2217333.1 hypothetical protein EV179_000483 [Coemansia sp. RSA 487]KAJ2572557.1 hypothetical protein IW140_000672 [Coemansia sp. RSA 1813]